MKLCADVLGKLFLGQTSGHRSISFDKNRAHFRIGVYHPPDYRLFRGLFRPVGSVLVSRFLGDRPAMENDPRRHTKRLCWWDLVWFRGSFLCKAQDYTKRNSDTTGPGNRVAVSVI